MGTRKRKRKKKHWRDHLVNNLLPARFQLVQFKPLIQKIVKIISGEEIYPLDIYQRFYRSLNTKLYGSGAYKTNTPLLLKSYITRLSVLEKEEIEQQCWLFLMELWDFHTYSWSKKGAASSSVFYDLARAQLARWMGSYIGNQIKMINTETIEQIPLIDWYEMDDPQIFKLDLGWVMLKGQNNIFSCLTIKQRYLLYLRYSKELTIEEISILVQQHRARIEEEFTNINKILHGETNDIART
jgi:hypothetical protein